MSVNSGVVLSEMDLTLEGMPCRLVIVDCTSNVSEPYSEKMANNQINMASPCGHKFLSDLASYLHEATHRAANLFTL